MMFVGLVLLSQLATFAYGQTAYGTSFAIAFPPIRESSKNSSETGYCRLVLSSLTQATVSIFGNGRAPTNITLNPAESLEFEGLLPCDDWRVTEGIESKVVFITASDPVSVLVSNADRLGNMDAFTAYPVDVSTNNSYFITGYENTGSGGESIANCGLPNDTSSFYTIVNPVRGNNTVRIYRPDDLDNPVETVILQDYETYTNITLVENYGDVVADFRGYYIEADSSIFLFAGGLCTDSTTQTTDWEGTTTTAMPPISQWRSGNHLTYDLRTANPGDGIVDGYPYNVVVMSAEDDNFVRLGSQQNATINRGVTAQISFLDSFDNILCEKPCLVTEFSQNRDQLTGVFALQVTPVELYNTFSGFGAGRVQNAANVIRIVTNANASASVAAITYTNIFRPEIASGSCGTKLGVEACQIVGIVGVDSFQATVRSLDPNVKFTVVVFWSSEFGRGYGMNPAVAERLTEVKTERRKPRKL